MMDKTNTLTPILMMLLWSFFIATSFPVSKMIAGDIDASVLTTLRFVMACIIFLPFLIMRKSQKNPNFRQFGKYIFLGGLTAFYFWCNFKALETTSSMNTAVIFTLVPGITAVLAWGLHKQKINFSSFVGLFLGGIGAVWVVFRGSLNNLALQQFSSADLIFLMGCVSLALFATLLKHFNFKSPVIVNTFWTTLCGAVWLILISSTNIQNTDWGSVTNTIWVSLIYLTIFPTIISFYILQYATSHLSSVQIMSFSYLIPLQVLIMNVVMGIEVFEWEIVPGVLTILLATWVVQQNFSNKQSRKINI